jgi:hypothetical protein
MRTLAPGAEKSVLPLGILAGSGDLFLLRLTVSPSVDWLVLLGKLCQKQRSVGPVLGQVPASVGRAKRHFNHEAGLQGTSHRGARA